MYLKNVTNFFKMVTFRLTLWYTVLFGMLSLVMFSVIYISLSFHLHKQLDRELLSKAREFSSLYMEDGIKALQAEFQREAKSRGIRRVFFQLLSETGEVLASSDVKHWGSIKAVSLVGYISGSRPVFRTLSLSERHHRVRVVLMPTRDGRLLVLGSTLCDSELMMERYRETFGTALIIMLVCGSLFGWFLAWKAMAGVKRVTQTAIQIREGNLAKRVQFGGEGLEIDNLAKVFNEMLDRMEVLVNELREVTDNIAHELRSPITRIRGIAETTLMGRSNLKDFQDMAGQRYRGK